MSVRRDEGIRQRNTTSRPQTTLDWRQATIRQRRRSEHRRALEPSAAQLNARVTADEPISPEGREVLLPGAQAKRKRCKRRRIEASPTADGISANASAVTKDSPSEDKARLC